jgi:tRNA(Ile)-lysidine synthase
MLEDFLSYIEANLSVFREDKILLAVSGGIDSMVMLHLFSQLGYNIEVAHINHSTRKGRSDEDMAFVNAHCRALSIPFHAITLNYSELKRGNFQENARNERFKFLYKIKEQQHCTWIATAHHKNDRWETFLMHLNRKSGIRGLTSLRGKEHQIIHPLLTFTKSQINKYAYEHNIEFVHDASNDTSDYLRNAIRHKITPEVETLFPDFILNVNRSISHLQGTSLLLRELIDHYRFESKNEQSGTITIALDKIKAFKNQEALLYFILEGFGFNYSTVNDILKTTNTGKLFESKLYQVLYDREKLILRLKKTRNQIDLSIDSPGIYGLPNGKKLVVQINSPKNTDAHLWLDLTKVKWPLKIRGIQPGDKFKPSGMKGATKSIKKFCTDLKIDRFTKEDLLVVEQEELILQIIGIQTCHNQTTTDIKNALTFNIID